MLRQLLYKTIHYRIVIVDKGKKQMNNPDSTSTQINNIQLFKSMTYLYADMGSSQDVF